MAIHSILSPERVLNKAWQVLVHNWYLGFTAFGGPPVHFKIFHDKFVDKLGWVDEEMYQELFAICQAFSGPGSTKMHYCLNLIHDGFLPAVLAFLIWSLPGALGMFGLSIGISNIGESLPRPVYALLSGLNAATVGIVVLAAVQLSQKSITDKMTRILVFLGASAGLLYNAVWYFPVLMLLAGCSTVIFDYKVLHGPVKWIMKLGRKKATPREEESVGMNDLPQRENANEQVAKPGITTSAEHPDTISPKPVQVNTSSSPAPLSDLPTTEPPPTSEHHSPRVIPATRTLSITWQRGATILTLFLLSFTVIMILRGVLPQRPLLYSLFANMYLAGTIIFGGGPVVIPLLREYVVAEGWVSARDFLIGLALIQAFPGPNFNFAVYLGSLTAIGGGYSGIWGAILGYLGIFVPGLVTVHGEMGIWSALRSKRWVKSALRGINAAAVGLIYTAVYRLWQIGFIDLGQEMGTSLGDDPWWVVVTATSYVGGYWFGLNAPSAIVLGAVMGLIRYAVVVG